MGNLVRCDVQAACDGATTDDPKGNGWSAVAATVFTAQPEREDEPDIGQVPGMPGVVAVGGPSHDEDTDHVDICPDCSGELRAEQVTSAFVQYLREFEGDVDE